MTRISSTLATAVLLAGMFAAPNMVSAQTKSAKAKEPEPPPLPPAQARLWLIAPTPTGPWTLRIENEGTIALRVPADVRLLRLEVLENDEAKPVVCEPPKALRPSSFPEDRALLLAPGQVYEESFDPRLLCFGKNAALLKTNATVRSRYGWDPPKPKDKKPAKAPFVVETTEREATVSPLRELRAPAILLAAPYVPPANAAPKADEPKAETSNGTAPTPPAVDERAGRIELSSALFIDASAPRTIAVNVTATNAGLRPITVALRPWMLSFEIQGPYGHAEMCYGDSSRRTLPPDAFRPLQPGKSTSFNMLLAEVCPKNAFPRSGVYQVTTTLDAKATTSAVDAYTAKVTVQQPTLIRLVTGAEPFYPEAPKAKTLPKPFEEDEEE